jgi:hypothetical protein
MVDRIQDPQTLELLLLSITIGVPIILNPLALLAMTVPSLLVSLPAHAMALVALLAF